MAVISSLDWERLKVRREVHLQAFLVLPLLTRLLDSKPHFISGKERMSTGLHCWSLVLGETTLRADLHWVSEEWRKLFYSGGEGSTTRAVSLTGTLGTAVMLWLQHPGALAGQHR